ncbi:hypothetical protein D3C76_1156480 [compost metagenome]
MRTVFEVFHQRLEKLTQLLELIGVQQVTGVEHHGLEFRSVAGNPGRGHRRLGAVAVDCVGQTVGESADVFGQRPASNQQGAFYRSQPARLPALQSGRCRQPQGADQAMADGRIGEVDIAVRHGTRSESWGSKCGP